MPESEGRWHLFEAFGIEAEYMIVDAKTLKVLPIADSVLKRLANSHQPVSDAERGSVAWSNELVAHLIELKCNGPKTNLKEIQLSFAEELAFVNGILKTEYGAKLMPSAMHPLFNPETETKLWPYDEEGIYATYHKIFNCRGHGWSNLQSVHINLPFYDEEEFGRLHAAVRIILPLIPALAASSPLVQGRFTGLSNSRLSYYLENQKRIPSIIGSVIPERVFSYQGYKSLLSGIYADIAPFDPELILRHEWLNSRAAVARFERNAIEIRLMDIQECPKADFAIISAIVSVIQALVQENWLSYAKQKEVDEKELKKVFLSCMKNGEKALITEKAYLDIFGFKEPMTAQDLWLKIVDNLSQQSDLVMSDFYTDLHFILEKGSLATRISKALKSEQGPPSPAAILAVYKTLCDNLEQDTFFRN